jgi:hypothetical protein
MRSDTRRSTCCGASATTRSSADPQRVLEILVPPRLHLQQHLFNPRHPQVEPTRQVLAIERELTFDVCQPSHVLRKQRCAFVGDRLVAPGERIGDTKRVFKLQPEAPVVIERLADVPFQRFEAARGPR